MGEPAKFILLTGGNSGIGLEACKILCAKGHKVVATVRSDEKGEHMLREVRAETPNADLSYMLCEMGDPRNIKVFAEDFKVKWLTGGQMLDVLINNAGCAYNFPERVTSQINPDWEQTMVVNAMAPILLTDLLMGNLKETAEEKGEARVVFVNTSILTTAEWICRYQTDMEDLMIAQQGKYQSGTQTYKNSKAVLMMATLAMLEELKEANVKVNSMCPGAVPGTNLFIANCHDTLLWRVKFSTFVMKLFGKSVRQGGQYIVDVADGERGSTQGLFYVKGSVCPAPPQVLDKEKQHKTLKMLREMANNS